MSLGNRSRRAAHPRRPLSAARMRLEELEPRWTPAWGGVPPTSIPVPTTAAQVSLVQNDASGSASIASSEVDYLSFTAGASGAYTISALTPASNLDTVLGVFSATGQRLAYNDDIVQYTQTDSRLTLNLVAGTRYYVGITNYTGSAGGAYTWSIDGPSATSTDDAFEDNDTRAAARDLGPLTSPRSITNLVMADGHDWYKITTNSAGTTSNYVQIDFTHSLGDLDLELYNSAGTRLATSNGTTNSERISLSGRAAGVYYVHVLGYQGAANPNYALTILPPGATTPPPTPTIDLVGAGVSTTAASQWGQTITVSSSVRNAGNTASGALAVQWYLSRDTVGSSDDLLLSQASGATSASYASVAGGATGAAINASLRLPTALPSGWSGSTFYVVMRTDSASQIAETNESNNFGQAGVGLDSAAISITVTPPTGGFQITVASTGMTASQQAAFQTAASRWAQVITGDLPNATFNGIAIDDLLINASGVAIDGPGGILGQAGPDRFRTASAGGLPYHGTMQFDTADLAAMEADGSLVAVITHEMGHVLGIGTLWSTKGLLTGAGTSNPRFTGPQATAAYNQIFGRSETGVPVENTGGSGTRDAHWRESTFNNELMTGWINSGSNPLSRVTIGSLADIGYQVNMNAANTFTPSSQASSLSGGGSTSAALLSPQSVDYWMSQLASGQAHDDDGLLGSLT